MQTYDIGGNINTKYASVIQMFFATAVLVYSLLIDKNEYAATAEKILHVLQGFQNLNKGCIPSRRWKIHQSSSIQGSRRSIGRF